MNTSKVVDDCFLEPAFFRRAEILWKQLERVLAADTESGSSPLTRISSPGSYAYLLVTAHKVFTQDLVLEFLSSLRDWGSKRLDANHASTPQIHIYADGCRRQLAPDAVSTRWHYLYSLSRSTVPTVQLFGGDSVNRTFLGIALRQITSFELGFGHLLVHDSRHPYALEAPIGVRKPLEGTILLHGYLW